MFYVENFRQLAEGDEVFVAMPFSRTFDPVWEEIYKPAITAVNLKPFRVDIRKVSDSIMIDILDGIGRARLILADISSVSGNWPNGNVLYELGIAHACRVPETVIVVRSGDRELPFDLKHIRVRSFDRSDHKAARRTVATFLQDALKEIAWLRDRLVDRAWSKMDHASRYVVGVRWYVEHREHEPGFVLGPFSPSAGDGRDGPYSHADIRSAYNRLQQVGVIEPVKRPFSLNEDRRRQLEYRWTFLGKTVAQKYLLARG
jgi:hypothetical protein